MWASENFAVRPCVGGNPVDWSGLGDSDDGDDGSDVVRECVVQGPPRPHVVGTSGEVYASTVVGTKEEAATSASTVEARTVIF